MLESTIYANCFLITNTKGVPVGYQKNGEVLFSVGDRVIVHSDSRGYIAPGIHLPGYGRIIEVCRDRTDHHFHVKMDSGESGYVKEARLTKV